MTAKLDLPLDEIKRLFVDEHWTSQRLADKYKCNGATILNRLHTMKVTVGSREIRPEQHGTLIGYNYYECRCEACRKAHSEYEIHRHATDDDAYALRRARRSRITAEKRSAKIDPKFTDRELADILIMSANCRYCEPTDFLELHDRKIDHIDEITNGGKHTADNIQILCDKHHRTKVACITAELEQAIAKTIRYHQIIVNYEQKAAA